MSRDALFEAYCRDALAADQAAELQALLEADAEARAAFAQHLLLHAGLSEASAQLHAHGAAAPGGLPRRRSNAARRSARRAVRRRSRRPGLGVLAVGLLVVAVVIWLLPPIVDGGGSRPGAVPSIDAPLQAASLESGASFERDGERHAFIAHESSELRPGDRLHAEGSVIRLRYADGTTLELEAGSQLQIESIVPGKHLLLENGALHASVAKQTSGQPLVVRSASASAVVLGTDLRLRAGDGWSDLAVSEGLVRYERAADGAALEVPGGFGARSAPGVAWAVQPLDAAPDIRVDLAAAVASSSPDWQVVDDATAAGGEALEASIEPNNPDRRLVATLTEDRALRVRIFAEGGVDYRLWLRGRTIDHAGSPLDQDMVLLTAPQAELQLRPWADTDGWGWLPASTPPPLPLFNGFGTHGHPGAWTWSGGPADPGQAPGIPATTTIRFPHTGIHELHLTPIEGPLRLDQLVLGIGDRPPDP